MATPTEYVQSIMSSVAALQDKTDEELADVADSLKEVDDELDSIVMALEEGD